MSSISNHHPAYALLRLIVFVLLALFLFSLTLSFLNIDTHKSPDQQATTIAATESVSFDKDIKPLLDKRCVVCHSCYDAPCQLKLSSVEGVLRGANKEKVYNPTRLTAIEPTRLFVDAKNTGEWRDKGFHGVLNEISNDSNNDNKPLLQMLLELKRLHPQPDSGTLPDEFTMDIDRRQECPTRDSFEKYSDEHPLWGMPYAMPALKQDEYQVLMTWLNNGAPMSEPDISTSSMAPQLNKWEYFLNQTSNKHRLVGRYIYEHLFHAHIHFNGSPLNEFYRLIRSSTPTGEPVDEIATLRPYDDPGTKVFYYRMHRYTPTIVAKNHIVYELSDERLERYKKLFINTDYSVNELPSYAPDVASNPFKVYADIPPDSRYRFLLDDARFFIEGFIKGPVCRGQIALNVIEDQFWVVFFNPDQKIFTTQPEFLNNMSDYLKIPSERGSHLNLLPIWADYWKWQKEYMTSKQRYFENMSTHNLDHAMNYIWNGNGTNPNSALTVFRHFDSASVEYGLVGDEPETAWVIDYPLLERIHYLLVAGFNIYGNIGHQLSTRIFMDFLRMEGEDHFLAFLPVNKRKIIRDSWYQGMRSELDRLFDAPMDWLKVESVIGYKTNDAQLELYHHLKQRMGNLLQHASNINQCGNIDCPGSFTSTIKSQIDMAMQKITDLRGDKLHVLPEVSYVRIVMDDPDQSFTYTMMRNKAYKNVVSLLSDERKRNQQDIDKDSLTVVNFLAGSYPNFFFIVHVNDINSFVSGCMAIENQKDFDNLIERFGVRRTNPSFWETADWFQAQYAQQRPLHSGLYDLSRYSNL